MKNFRECKIADECLKRRRWSAGPREAQQPSIISATQLDTHPPDPTTKKEKKYRASAQI